MSKLIPANRVELGWHFSQAARKLVKDHKGTTESLVADLVPELLEQVPSSAFDPIQPVDKGILFYHGDVDEGQVEGFQHDLMRTHLNLKPGLPITLNLSSVGGSVYAGLALISTIFTIQRQGRKVNIHIQGVAMSMASVLAQVANYRTIEPSAQVMLHEMRYGMDGSTADHDEEREFSYRLQDELYKHYCRRTGKSLDYYRQKLKRRNWYMSAQEALEQGLVDEILPTPDYGPPTAPVEKPVEKPTAEATFVKRNTRKRKSLEG